MQEFSAAGFAEYLDIIRATIEEGQRAGVFRGDVKPIVAAKILYGALDEMVTNWILSKKPYPLAPMADEVLRYSSEVCWSNDERHKRTETQVECAAYRGAHCSRTSRARCRAFQGRRKTSTCRTHLNYKTDGEWQAISSARWSSGRETSLSALYSLGLRKGDRAAILAANSPEWTLADAGCQFAGVIDVPIYTTLAPTRSDSYLNDSGHGALPRGYAAYRTHRRDLARCAVARKGRLF